MKRYDIDYIWDGEDEDLVCQMEEFPDGSYVRYETAEKLARAYRWMSAAGQLWWWITWYFCRHGDVSTAKFDKVRHKARYAQQKARRLYKEAMEE